MDAKSSDQVAALRMLTEFTGQITDIQVKTLNAWPLVMIPEVKSHEVNIDLNERKVVYKLKFKAKKSLKDFSALSKIEQGVWALLGDTWLTIFKADRRIIYAGSRRKMLIDEQGFNLGQGREGFDPQRAGSVPQVRGSREAPAGGKHGG